MRLSVLMILVLWFVTTGIAYQQPPSQTEPPHAPRLKLTPEAERDSYEIYSMMLRREWPGGEASLRSWAIKRETQTAGNEDRCLEPLMLLDADRLPPVYRELIADARQSNRQGLVLERKFDLPEYAIITPSEYIAFLKPLLLTRQPRTLTPNRWNLSDPRVLYEVSAVGFNNDRTRALVYVGHYCGSLCGGGAYHFLVKRDAKWQPDEDRLVPGSPCMWAS